MLAAHTNLTSIVPSCMSFRLILCPSIFTFLHFHPFDSMRHNVPVQVRPATPVFGRLLGNVPVVDYTDL